MSDDKNDGKDVTPICCYWYNQGKCFLFELPCVQDVFDILRTVPKAREDLLNCAGRGHCEFYPEPCPPDQKDEDGFVTQDFIDYAKNPDPLCDPQQKTDEFMNMINQYVDNHRTMSVFKNAKNSGDSDE